MEKLLKRLEDMDPAERDKIKSVLREKATEEEAAKVGWMYKDGKPDNEEYLLGRRIDHHVDKDEEIDTTAPGAIFAEAVARRQDIDMQAKMREDPLFAIKQREEDAKKKLLLNPIKMKQLQQIVERNAPKKKHKKEKKKKHKKKSHSDDSEDERDDDARLKQYLALAGGKKDKKKDKKSKKKKSKRHDSSDSDSDGGDDLLQKYLQILSAKKGPGEKKEGSKKQESGSDSEKDTSVKKKHMSVEKKDKGRKRYDSSDSESERGHRKNKDTSGKDTERRKPHIPAGYGLITPDGYAPSAKSAKKSRSKSPSSKHRHRSRSPRRRSRSPRRRSRSPKRRSRSPRKKSKSPDRKRKSSPKRKLTAEEKERKRREMMSDAAWRDEQREANVKRYKEEDAKEVEETHKGSSGDFINPLILKHAASSSVEDRIKRNRYNLQRSGSSMGENSYLK